MAAAALSSCGAVAKKEPQAQAAATAENSAVLRAVTVVDGDSLTLEGQTLCADEADQSVLVVKNGGSVVLRNCTITKTGGTADSASAIEGVNAALVAQSGGNLVLENCTIETDGKGASALAAVGRQCLRGGIRYHDYHAAGSIRRGDGRGKRLHIGAKLGD